MYKKINGTYKCNKCEKANTVRLEIDAKCFECPECNAILIITEKLRTPDNYYSLTTELMDTKPPVMTFDEYQEKAETTALYLNSLKAEFPELPEKVVKILGISYVSLGLGESGEVQNKVKKIIRDAGGEITEKVIDAIKGELGDILWYIALMCKELDITMESVAEANIEKLFGRKERGVLQGSGDNR